MRSQLHEERPHTKGTNCSSPSSAYHLLLLLSFCSDLVFLLKINLPDKVSDKASQEGPQLVCGHIQLSHFAVAERAGGLPSLNLISSPIFWEVRVLHRESEQKDPVLPQAGKLQPNEGLPCSKTHDSLSRGWHPGALPPLPTRWTRLVPDPDWLQKA